MKRFYPILASMTLLIAAGCYPTRIVTVSPYTSTQSTYTTTVAVPRAKTVTTSTCTVSAADDISLYLDLQAVGAAFAQSSTIQDFEYLLNNSSYMLSNLDLNGDGFVDYLRVMESCEGYNHVYVIQACLSPNVFQDVATLVAEVSGPSKYYVEVIGSPYIYGANYIVRPVFVSLPPIITHIYRPSYRRWSSPWYWNHYPSCYKHPAPILLSHYEAYVHTYMREHRYCHGFSYATDYHFRDYGRLSSGISRNDYAKQNPDRSFTVRTATIPTANNRTAVNARDIYQSRTASTRTETQTTPTRRAATTAATNAASSGTTSARTSSSASARTSTSSASTGATVRPATTSSSSSSTTSPSTSSTSARSGSSSSARSSATTSSPATSSSSSSSSRTSSTTSSPSSSSSSATSARSSSSSGSRTASSTGTTVQSRVNRSGSSSTSISTTNSSGTTTTSRTGSSSSARTSSSSAARTGSSSARR